MGVHLQPGALDPIPRPFSVLSLLPPSHSIAFGMSAIGCPAGHMLSISGPDAHRNSGIWRVSHQ
eukprot:5277278-Pyramimonas_sp.AAC.1